MAGIGPEPLGKLMTTPFEKKRKKIGLVSAMDRKVTAQGFMKGEQVGSKDRIANQPVQKFARKTASGAVVKSVLPEAQRQIAIKNHPDLFGKNRKDSFSAEDRKKRQRIIQRRLSASK